MADQSYAQLSSLMLGMKLQANSKLEDAQAIAGLESVAREIRDALIRLGKRKRKVLSDEQKARMAAARKKGGRRR